MLSFSQSNTEGSEDELKDYSPFLKNTAVVMMLPFSQSYTGMLRATALVFRASLVVDHFVHTNSLIFKK